MVSADKERADAGPFGLEVIVDELHRGIEAREHQQPHDKKSPGCDERPGAQRYDEGMGVRKPLDNLTDSRNEVGGFSNHLR